MFPTTRIRVPDRWNVLYWWHRIPEAARVRFGILIPVLALPRTACHVAVPQLPGIVTVSRLLRVSYAQSFHQDTVVSCSSTHAI
jgi:hypothetical protein